MLARKAGSTRNVTKGMALRLASLSMKMVGLTLPFLIKFLGINNKFLELFMTLQVYWQRVAVQPSALCSTLSVKITRVWKKVKNFVIAATIFVTATWPQGQTWLYISWSLQSQLDQLLGGHYDNNYNNFHTMFHFLTISWC